MKDQKQHKKKELVHELNKMQKDSFFSYYKIDTIENISNLTLKELSKYNLLICDMNIKKLKDSLLNKNTKPKKLKILQLGHGSMAKFYNIYGDNMNTPNSIYDYIIAPNEYSFEIFVKSGWAEDKIIKSGMPRIHSYKKMDTQLIKERIERTLNIEIKNKTLHLFAPSWIKRKDSVENNLNQKITYNIDFITKNMNKNDLLIIAPHINNCKNGENYIDFFSKFDIDFLLLDKVYSDFKGEHLMLISDFLYTDFSSIIFDYNSYVKTNKKSFLYSPINDQNQSYDTRKIYDDQYGKWGTINNEQGTLFKTDSKLHIIENDKLTFYNYENEEYAIEKIIEFIRKISKSNK